MKALKDLLANVDIIDCIGPVDREISGVTIDSRKVTPGACFIAVKGYREDGLKYVKDAVEKGAVVVVARQKPPKEYSDICWVQVKNDRLAFSKIAANFYDNVQDSYYAVGVTGTNGKTTITALLSAILSRQTKTAQIGTLGMQVGDVYRGTQLTTPESVDIYKFLADAREEGAENLVMEVSSVSLVLHRVEDIKFSQAIFTTFSGDHLDFHKTMEEYLAAKMILFRNLGEDNWAVINIDDPAAPKIIRELNCKYLTYGFSEDADVRPLKYKFTIGGGTGINALIKTPRGDIKIASPLIGRLNLMNIMAAVTSAVIKGVPFDIITAAVAEFKPVKGRLDFAYSGDYSVLIDYAHTDNALEMLLQSMREMVAGRLIVVFGAGGSRDKTKRPRMGKAASENSDFVIVTSDNPRQEEPGDIINDILQGFDPGYKNYIVEPDREAAIKKAVHMAVKGDLVVVAGKGHENYQIFKDRTIHFDDFEVVREVVKDLSLNR